MSTSFSPSARILLCGVAPSTAQSHLPVLPTNYFLLLVKHSLPLSPQNVSQPYLHLHLPSFSCHVFAFMVRKTTSRQATLQRKWQDCLSEQLQRMRRWWQGTNARRQHEVPLSASWKPLVQQLQRKHWKSVFSNFSSETTADPRVDLFPKCQGGPVVLWGRRKQGRSQTGRS